MWPLWALACATPEGAEPPADPVVTPGDLDLPPNLLVLVLDDVGAQSLERTGDGLLPTYPSTPNLDALADAGVVFRNVWSEPTCTPSRVAALTGLAPWRTGVGTAVSIPSDWHLSPGTPTLPAALSANGYATAAIGKWHLGEEWSTGYALPDRGWGFDHTVGTIANLGVAGSPELEAAFGYYHYVRYEDGAAAWETTYATTQTVDDTLAWIDAAPEPWFTWVGFHAAHVPFQAPPAELLEAPVSDDAPDLVLYGAMIEALDHEIGRLLEGIPADVRERTTIFVAGDNGIAGTLLPLSLYGRGKGSTFQLGIHVPFVVSGRGVAEGGRESDAVLALVDLAPTLAALGGSALDAPDGVDFSALLTDPGGVAPREVAFSEAFVPNFDPAAPPPPFLWSTSVVRDARYKLHQVWDAASGTRRELLFDLVNDPGETADLLLLATPEHQAVADRLRAARDAAREGSPVPP